MRPEPSLALRRYNRSERLEAPQDSSRLASNLWNFLSSTTSSAAVELHVVEVGSGDVSESARGVQLAGRRSTTASVPVVPGSAPGIGGAVLLDEDGARSRVRVRARALLARATVGLAEPIEDVRQNRDRCRLRSHRNLNQDSVFNRAQRTLIRPLSGVNLMALESISEHLLKALGIAFDRRQVGRRVPGHLNLPGVGRRQDVTDRRVHQQIDQQGGTRSISSLPVMIRDTSRISSMNCPGSWRRLMTSNARRTRSGDKPSVCSICTQPRMALSGTELVREHREELVLQPVAPVLSQRASSFLTASKQTPFMRTGRPRSYSTRPLPSTQRTVPSGATMRYSTSCGRPCSMARRADASTRSRSSG